MRTTTPTVFIATDASDVHADQVVQALHDRDVAVFRFHPEDFPTRSSITLTPSSSGIEFTVRNAHHEVCSRDVIAAWYRRPGPVTPAPVQPDIDDFVRRQATDTVRAVYRALDGRWLAAPDALRIAEDKMVQLHRAAELGLRVPRTCLTNDPADVREFRHRVGGALAVKPQHVQGVFVDGRFRFPLTSRWDGDVADAAIAAAPTIFQEMIHKAAEVRAVVVGDRVFAAEIPAGETDVREQGDEVLYRPHRLPAEVEVKLLELTHGFGVEFASADLVVTPDGGYVFLELNPNGQWLWLEFDAGLPLTTAVVEHFLATLPEGVPAS